jgi:hypothetical protein
MARVDFAEPLAETFEPRRERSLFGRRSFAITVSVARVVAHASDIRDRRSEIAAFAPPPRPGGRY